jgi:hypothetical protein
MIFEWRRQDSDYHPWFAWHPVTLYGPNEWDRERRLGARPRIVWLRTVLRWRCPPRTYYVLPDPEAS